MNRQPFLYITICFILGVFLQDYISLPLNVIVIVLIISILTLFSTFYKKIFFIKLKALFLGLLFFSSGLFFHFLNNKISISPDVEGKQTVIFKLSKKLNSTEKYRRYEVEFWINSEKHSSVMSVDKDQSSLDFNHFYQAKTYINKITKPTQNYQFNYQKYLARKGIFYQMFVNDDIQVAQNTSLGFIEKVKQKRLKILENIDHSALSKDSKSFVKGIILADRTEMGSAIVSDFTKTGLIHLLAISGTHIAIIFGLFYWFFTTITPRKFRNIAIVISVVLIWFFALFIGFGNSVIRACLMLSIYYFYVIIQRKPDLLHALSLAAFMILIFDSNQIFDVGFQLSFSAVLGIYWIGGPILSQFKKVKYFKKVKLLGEILAITLAAQIATLPLILYYFHQFSLISIVSNLIIIPLAEVIIIFSFLMTLILEVTIKVNFIEVIYDYFITFVLKVIHWFATISDYVSSHFSFNLVELVMLFLVIYFLRYAILESSIKNYYRLGLFFLLFCAVRFGFDVYEYQKTEVLVHQFHKEKLFSIRQKGEIYFWVKNTEHKDQMVKYIIDPYLIYSRSSGYKMISLPQNTKEIVWNGKIYNVE